MSAWKSTSSVVVSAVLWVSLGAAGVCLVGCEDPEISLDWSGSRVPEYRRLSSTYDQIKVNSSLTLDVLPKIDALKDELTCQSESTVASVGRSEDGGNTWFTLVGFHQYNLTAVRKYFFLIDEESKRKSERGCRFDCEVVLDKVVLTSAAKGSSSAETTVLKAVLEHLRGDVADVGSAASSSDQTLQIGVYTLNQAFRLAMLKLESSPALLARLGDAQGVAFEHMSFGQGRIGLAVTGEVATVKLRLGALADRFQETSGAVAPGPAPASAAIEQ